MAKITVLGYRCERCLHEWVPRRSSTDEPRTCPKCKSPYWDRPRRVVKDFDRFSRRQRCKQPTNR